FHTWYANTPVLVDEAPLRDARLALARAVQQVLANGLGLLGVGAPERMYGTRLRRPEDDGGKTRQEPGTTQRQQWPAGVGVAGGRPGARRPGGAGRARPAEAGRRRLRPLRPARRSRRAAAAGGRPGGHRRDRAGRAGAPRRAATAAVRLL